MTWRVKLFEVFENQRADEKPTEVPGFGVEAEGMDAAREAAQAWLRERGLTVRSMSLSADAKETLVVVVKKKRGK